MSTPTNVTVNLHIDIDLEAWASEYGLEVQDARADFKEHMGHVLQGWLEAQGYYAEVKVRKP